MKRRAPLPPQVSAFFPEGFLDRKYIDWERGYKWKAHQQWIEGLNRRTDRALLQEHRFTEIAARAVRVESRTSVLFSFEKMAVRNIVQMSQSRFSLGAAAATAAAMEDSDTFWREAQNAVRCYWISQSTAQHSMVARTYPCWQIPTDSVFIASLTTPRRCNDSSIRLRA